MDYKRIINQKGYRVEDLKPKDQDVINCLRCLLEDFDNFEYQCEDFMLDDDKEISIIGKMKEEIADDVIKQVKDWIDIQIMEYQIAMAESEGN